MSAAPLPERPESIASHDLPYGEYAPPIYEVAEALTFQGNVGLALLETGRTT